MKAHARGTLFLSLVMLPACGQQLVEFSKPDAAKPDAASTDLAIADAAIHDAEVTEADIPDAAIPDGGSRDTGKDDGPVDVDAIDDSGNQAAEGVDAAATEAGHLDPQTRDSPVIDAQITDVRGLDDAVAEPVVVLDLGSTLAMASAACAGLAKPIASPVRHVDGNVASAPSQTRLERGFPWPGNGARSRGNGTFTMKHGGGFVVRG
jgi:hypothetical protein